MRTPSPKKSFSAKTKGRAVRAVKKSVNPCYGKKGMGMINNPKKSTYNKVYNKTTYSTNHYSSRSSNTSEDDVIASGCGCLTAIIIFIGVMCFLNAIWV